MNPNSNNNMAAPLVQELLGAADVASRCCRICLSETCAPNDQLISPCLCRGSQQWVHRSCLDHWRTVGTSVNSCAFTHCCECGFEYRLRHVPVYSNAENRMAEFRKKLIKRSCIFFLVIQFFIISCAVLIGVADIECLHGKLRKAFPISIRDSPEEDLLMQRGIYYIYGCGVVLCLAIFVNSVYQTYRCMKCMFVERSDQTSSRTLAGNAIQNGDDTQNAVQHGMQINGQNYFVGETHYRDITNVSPMSGDSTTGSGTNIYTVANDTMINMRSMNSPGPAYQRHANPSNESVYVAPVYPAYSNGMPVGVGQLTNTNNVAVRNEGGITRIVNALPNIAPPTIVVNGMPLNMAGRRIIDVGRASRRRYWQHRRMRRHGQYPVRSGECRFFCCWLRCCLDCCGTCCCPCWWCLVPIRFQCQDDDFRLIFVTLVVTFLFFELIGVVAAVFLLISSFYKLHIEYLRCKQIEVLSNHYIVEDLAVHMQHNPSAPPLSDDDTITERHNQNEFGNPGNNDTNLNQYQAGSCNQNRAGHYNSQFGNVNHGQQGGLSGYSQQPGMLSYNTNGLGQEAFSPSAPPLEEDDVILQDRLRSDMLQLAGLQLI